MAALVRELADPSVSTPNGLHRPFSPRRSISRRAFYDVSIPNGLHRPFSLSMFSHCQLQCTTVSIPNGLHRPFSLEGFEPIAVGEVTTVALVKRAIFPGIYPACCFLRDPVRSTSLSREPFSRDISSEQQKLRAIRARM